MTELPSPKGMLRFDVAIAGSTWPTIMSCGVGLAIVSQMEAGPQVTVLMVATAAWLVFLSVFAWWRAGRVTVRKLEGGKLRVVNCFYSYTVLPEQNIWVREFAPGAVACARTKKRNAFLSWPIEATAHRPGGNNYCAELTKMQRTW